MKDKREVVLEEMKDERAVVLEEGEFDRDTMIEPTALDVEWVEQPSLARKYGKLLAYWTLRMEKAKEQYEVVAAKLDKQIRESPATFGISGKVTETVIANAVKLSAEYRAAYKEYLDVRYEYMVVKEAGMRAIDHKKAALENLVKLHGQQYFAGPNVPRDLDAEVLARGRQRSADKKVRMLSRR